MLFGERVGRSRADALREPCLHEHPTLVQAFILCMILK